MYGGILSKASIVIIEDQDLLIASFSHQLYEFSIQQATLTNIRAHHQQPILYLHYDQQNGIVSSIDEEGTLVSYSVFKGKKIENSNKKKMVFGKKQLIKSAIIRANQNEIQIYGLTQSGKLLRHRNGTTGTVLDRCSKLLYLSDEHLITLQDANIVQIIKPTNLQTKFTYEHNFEVTSVEVYQNNLIVGDEKGKINILVGFLQKGEIKMRQKLQWHVHEVRALKTNGAYLYSAGEEGVVVMWHLRENVKDFLPRIGSKIDNLIIQESKLYCLLSDNTIKSIDFNNDKAVSQYKVIIDSHVAKISQDSSKFIQNNLIRVSKSENKVYLRSLPGRIQQINLHSGINTEFNILSRNLISRLDNSLPNPHQITDFCFTKDGANLVVAVEGANYRSLKFYQYEKEDFKLVSKVENCHSGHSRIHLLNVHDKFVSYADDDSHIKVWKLSTRRKQSIMDIQQHFWCCDYEITFRGLLPAYVSFDKNRIIITYDSQFVLFNIVKKMIDNVYERPVKSERMVAVHGGLLDSHQSFLVFYDRKVQLMTSLKEIKTVLKIEHQNAINADNIVFSRSGDKFAVLINEDHISHVYAYSLNENVCHYQLPRLKDKYLTDLFWIGPRLMAFDSSLYCYDLTHQKPLVTLSNKLIQNEAEMEVEQQPETAPVLDYQSLYKRYLQKQFRKDKSSVEKTNQILGVAPSISGCFSMLAHQIFI